MKRTLFIFLAASAYADAQVGSTQLGSQPGLNWRLGSEIAYDDNVFRTAALEESDTYIGIQPELAWYGFAGANQFDVALTGDFRRYQDQDVLDFDTYAARVHALLDHSIRLNTDYILGYEDGVEKPGETGQLFLPGQGPNEFELWSGSWKLNYGAQDATGQLAASVRYSEQRFDNNDQQFRDADTTGFTGTFFYRIAPRTRLLLEVDYTDFGFIETDAFGRNQSGDQLQYLSGITWEATGNTTGEFRIGYRDRSFDEDAFENLSGLALALDMTWQPDELTQVSVGAIQDNQSSALQGVGGLERTGANIDFYRSIGPRSGLTADIGYDQLAFAGGVGRDDDRWTAGVGFEYRLLSRLTVGLEYRYEDRNSSFELFNFTSNALVLNFTLTPPR